MMHYQFAAVFTAYFFLNYKMYKQILINVIKTLSIELTIYFLKRYLLVVNSLTYYYIVNRNLLKTKKINSLDIK